MLFHDDRRFARAIHALLGLAALPGTLLIAGCSSSTTGTPGGTTSADGGNPIVNSGDSGPPASHGGSDASSSDAAPGALDSGGSSSAGFACSPNGGGCDCIITGTGTSPAKTCPPSAMPNPVCCAGEGYPETDISSCLCENYACTEMNDGLCQCTLDSTGTATGSSCPGTYAHCCENVLSDNSVNGCVCGLSPCQAGDTEVASCSVALITCTGASIGTKLTTSCR